MAIETVAFHPAAAEELEHAQRWYIERSALAALAFVMEVQRAVAIVCDTPDRWPIHVAATRRYSFRRFPFDLVYQVRNGSVIIVAVSHHRRKPGYWLSRAET